MQYRLWRATASLLSRLPLRLSYALADVLGWLGFWLWPRGRRATIANFRHVLAGHPEREIRRTARRSLQGYCRYLVDFARFSAASSGPQPTEAALEGVFGQLDDLLARAHGAVIVCMHYGNWDAGAAVTAARGYDATVIGESFGDPRLDALVFGARERLGVKVVSMDHAGPSLIRGLKRGGLLALLTDRPTPGAGVAVSFFNAIVEVPSGPARLARAAGAALVPVAFPRISPHRPEVAILADFSIPFERTSDPDADIRRLTQAALSEIGRASCKERV